MVRVRTFFAFLAFLGMSGLASSADKEIKLEKTTMEQLEKTIASHKGKVVLVDVWADFCIPCKKKFPYIVKMHEDHAAKGLVVISLTIDDEAEGKAAALEFLKKQKAQFTNLVREDTDANVEKYKAKLETNTPPIVHVFGRDGAKAKTFEADAKIEDIEKLVKELLEKK